MFQQVWTDKYSVHDSDIDEQHMMLFELIASIAEIDRSDFSKELYEDYITALIKYTQSHFTSEELHMQTACYPDFDRHKQLHGYFIDYANSLADNIDKARYEDMAEIAKFLEKWITQHILIEDMKYSAMAS
jgi:hemerythrin